jgi:RHS repeat-associated protein
MSPSPPVWMKDEAGFISYTLYDQATGAVIKTISDVDTTQTGTFANLPSGWTTPSGGGLHQTSTSEVDELGRTTKVTDPNGNVSYVVYNDVAKEVRSYVGWDTSTNLPTGPTSVSRQDWARGYNETLTMSATPAVSGGKPTGTESISGVQTLSRAVLNDAGQAVAQDQYFTLSGTSYSQSTATLGTSGTNYHRTQVSFDKLGRVERTISPAGTISRTVFDGPGRVTSQWIGTVDTPTSGFWSPTNLTGTDMIQLSGNEYDNGGVGDGNLTRTIQYPGGGAADRKSDLFYDWRNRPVATKAGVESSESTSLNRPIGYTEYDNLGQAIVSEMYDGDGITITSTSGVPNRPSSSLLRAKSTAEYDELGRVYQSKTFSVDPSSGSVSSNALQSDIWRDLRGQTIKSKQPGGLVSKGTYDGLGRTTKSSVTDGGGDTGYGDADDVTGDIVLSESTPTYDANGNVLKATSKDRFHDETATGALGTPSTGAKARVSYAAMYYDKANRMTDSVNVGTNAGSAYTRPGTVPSRSDTVLVSSVGYNAAGWQETSTDPKGLISKTYYDLLGRTTKTIENYVDGTVSDTDDKTVEYIYGPSGMTKLQAKLTGGGQQETEWVYGITSPVVSNDTLKEMRYPDSSTGSSSSSEKDAYTYNQLGEVLTTTDRNGNVHTITRDVLGRVTSDAVTTLGSGVDGAVRRIETAYDSQGNAYLVTSYNAASGGSIVNQIQREYNGLGQLIAEYQATNGAVNTSTTPKVQYSYSFAPSGSTNHSRLATMTYPNGRVLTYNYSSGLNSDISRLSSITDGATTLESYDYLGLGTVVRRGHAEPGVDLTSIKLSGESDSTDSGDKYIGLDRFGRIVDQRWTTSGASAKERTQYGYDRNSNRLWRENLLDTSRSELYTYDGLNQLTTFDRGTLNGTKTGLTGAASRSQAWNFDAIGNFDSQTTDGTTQSRTANRQNEITSISGGLASPTYDANGNTKRDENRDVFKYDAWNRLVEVNVNNGITITYSWDGTGRRVREVRAGTTTDLYYSSAWQVIEERVGGTVYSSYAWSPVYVDAMIARDRDSDSNGSLEERLYAMHDANFNIVGLIDAGGDVIERFAYDPFGTFEVLDRGWSPIGSSSYAWIYLHQGGRWDADAGVFSFRHREYSPTLGRWMTNDPIGFEGGTGNFYQAYGNSINVLDPLGLQGLVGEGLRQTPKSIELDDLTYKTKLIDKLKSCPEAAALLDSALKKISDGKINIIRFKKGDVINGIKFDGRAYYVPKNTIYLRSDLSEDIALGALLYELIRIDMWEDEEVIRKKAVNGDFNRDSYAIEREKLSYKYLALHHEISSKCVAAKKWSDMSDLFGADLGGRWKTFEKYFEFQNTPRAGGGVDDCHAGEYRKIWDRRFKK